MTLPPAYAWLAAEPGPRMLKSALAFYGLHEAPGGADNPVIIGWARELGIPYDRDMTPWCGLFMAKVAHDAGKPVPSSPLWALNWAGFGLPIHSAAMLGDVLVFKRPGGGHVGLYVGDDADAYHVLGGNTGDAVAVARVARARLYAVRRPDYHATPANVRAIRMGPSGPLSTNEA